MVVENTPKRCCSDYMEQPDEDEPAVTIRGLKKECSSTKEPEGPKTSCLSSTRSNCRGAKQAAAAQERGGRFHRVADFASSPTAVSVTASLPRRPLLHRRLQRTQGISCPHRHHRLFQPATHHLAVETARRSLETHLHSAVTTDTIKRPISAVRIVTKNRILEALRRQDLPGAPPRHWEDERFSPERRVDSLELNVPGRAPLHQGCRVSAPRRPGDPPPEDQDGDAHDGNPADDATGDHRHADAGLFRGFRRRWPRGRGNGRGRHVGNGHLVPAQRMADVVAVRGEGDAPRGDEVQDVLDRGDVALAAEGE
jgi:hypothetical protein